MLTGFGDLGNPCKGALPWLKADRPVAGVSLAAEPALGWLVAVLTGLAQCPVLIDDSEEVHRKATELMTNAHGPMLITPAGDVNPSTMWSLVVRSPAGSVRHPDGSALWFAV